MAKKTKSSFETEADKSLLEEAKSIYNELREFYCLDVDEEGIDVTDKELEKLGLLDDCEELIEKQAFLDNILDHTYTNVLEAYKDLQDFKKIFNNIRNKYPTARHMKEAANESGWKKALKFGLKLATSMAEAEANAPVVGWQCQYCGQVIYAKHRPNASACPMYFRAGSNASKITPHAWNRIN
jgi:ribonucleotide reductase beta subunit family protein with ferritin-like domain